MIYDALDSTPLERPRSLPQSYYGLVGDTINRRPAIILPRDSMSFGKYLRGARRQRVGTSVRQLRGAVKYTTYSQPFQGCRLMRPDLGLSPQAILLRPLRGSLMRTFWGRYARYRRTEGTKATKVF